MSTTISTHETSEYLFRQGYRTLVITSTGGISINGGYAVVGYGGSLPMTVTNAGTLHSSDAGIELFDGSTIINTGSISGPGNNGVVLAGYGTVFNSGSISGDDGIIFVAGSGLASNTGAIIGTELGVLLTTGGTATNAGTITGGELALQINGGGTVVNTGTLIGGEVGVYLANGGTVLNAGTITGGDGKSVQFDGTQNSRLILDPGAVFNGTIAGGSGVNVLELAGYGTYGTITSTLASQYAGFAQVTVDASAYWTLTQNIGAGITINNAGYLTLSSASFTNAGAIYSSEDTPFFTGRTFTNTGAMVSTGPANIVLTSGGAVFNSGSLGGLDGIRISGGAGYVANTGDVNVQGRPLGKGVFPEPVRQGGANAAIGVLSGGTVVNTGIIAALENAGIFLAGGGTVQNAGTIAGTIGGYATAVEFSGSQSARLIIDPGASFNGTVSGGTGLNILELAGPSTVYRNGSSYYYADAVITHALASQYVGFNQITIDAGAYWTLEQDIGAGITINNAGYLILSSASFTNAGVIYSSESSPVFIGGTFTNTGTLINTNFQGDGIDLVPGATIANAGSIFGATGIQSGGGVILNTGTVTGGSAGVMEKTPPSSKVGVSGTPGTVVNSGSISGDQGVQLFNGGTVINTGTITGTDGDGVNIAGGGTVVNAGMIASANGYSVQFYNAARLVLDPGARFDGTVQGGTGPNILELAGPSTIYRNGSSYSYYNGNIANTLASQYAGFNQITVDPGADWTLEQDIGAGITITNSGALFLGHAHSTFTNAGVIYSGATGALYVTGATVTNTGSIITQNFYNLQFLSGGTVFNGGSVGGAEGVQVKGGAGYVANTGIINVEGLDIPPKGAGAPPSSLDFAAIALFDGGTVVNSGTVSASQNTGISLLDGGTLINTGTVLGESFGVFASGGTVLNAGTISGADGQAVRFQGSASDRLILDPGASFYGTVSGGTGIDILELAAPAASHYRGVIADSLASQYVGFNQVTVDAGAYWALYQGIGPGITITNAGELLLQDVPPPGLIPIGGFGAGNPYPVFINAGVIYSGASGALNMQLTTAVNTGTIIGTQGYALNFQGFTLYNSGDIGGAAGVSLTSVVGDEKAQFTSVTLVNSGTIAGSDGVAVKFRGGDPRLVIDPGAVFQGTVTGGIGINTLELAGPDSFYRNGYSYYYHSGVISSTLASQYAGFNQVKVDAGADWTLYQDIGAGITITNAGQLSLLPSTGTLTNAGVIVSTAAGKLTAAPPRSAVFGVQMFNTGTILAAQGYGIALSRGTLVNSGSIGGPAGVELEGVKVETGFNPGQTATYTYFRSTLVNSGTITGTDGTAVAFTGIDDARLVIDPGAVFNGTVSGVAGVNTLELASGSSIGTIANIGARYVNFRDVTIDSGAEWQLGGTLGAGGSAVNLGALLGASSSLGSGTAPAGLAATGATLDNAGLITGGDAYGLSGLGGIGVSLTGGALTNTGNIYGGYAYGREGAGGAGAVLDGGIFANTGRITGGKLDVQAGNAPGAAGAGVMLAAGTLITSGTITGGVKTATDTRSDAVQFAGAAVLIVESGADFIGQAAADSTADILEVSGTSADALTGIGTQFTGFSQISFAAGAAWTLTGNSLGLADGEAITGFTFGDTLDLTGFSAASETFSNGALTLSNGGTRDILDLAGAAPTDHFSISSDGNSGTEIAEVTCFVSGTRIATARGEVPVEALMIGDQVRTLHAGLQPIKWIGRRSYGAPFCNHKKILPIRIAAHALADGVPSRDLLVSPGHAIFLNGVLIHAALLVNGVTITQARSLPGVTYFHIELENHEVILAENCPGETYRGECFRRQFQNAESFSALYPGARAPEHFCAPVLTRGFHLAAILRRLRARAGIAPNSPGPLRGYIDQCMATTVSGWAVDLSAPDEPVILDILSGRRRIGRVTADLPRPDVAAAGYGAGQCGFQLTLPAGAAGLVVRHAVSGQVLRRIDAPWRLPGLAA